MMQSQLGSGFLLIFCIISFFETKPTFACVSNTNTAYISTETHIFTSFLTQNNIFYFSFDATYYIACHDAANIMLNFH